MSWIDATMKVVQNNNNTEINGNEIYRIYFEIMIKINKCIGSACKNNHADGIADRSATQLT